MKKPWVMSQDIGQYLSVFILFYFLSVVVLKTVCANQTEKEVSLWEFYCFIPSFIMAEEYFSLQ